MDSFKVSGFTVSSFDIHPECILILLLKTMERISKEKLLTDKWGELLQSVCNNKIKIQIPI